MRVLMVTSVWPTASNPHAAPFVVRQVEYLRREGIDVDVYPLNGRKNPFNYVRARREVHSLLASSSYDLVHAQWGQSALAALPKRIPLVVTLRGSDVEGDRDTGGRVTLAGHVLKRLTGIVVSAADEVILVSNHMRKFLPQRQYHVIPSGLDLNRFRPLSRADARSQLGLTPGRRYVLFAAAPANPIKRHGLAAEAVRRMRERHDVELIIAHGCPHDSIPLYMNACDALIVTSTHEGSPNVVKEALACNLPVVSVDVGDVSERISDVAGCRISVDDSPEAVALALRDVLDFRRPIEGRAAVNGLEEGVLTRRVIDVYHQAVSARRLEPLTSSAR